LDIVWVTMADEGASARWATQWRDHVDEIIRILPSMVGSPAILAPGPVPPALDMLTTDVIEIEREGEGPMHWIINDPAQTDTAVAAIESMLGRPTTLA
jgi:hypothetical protein